MGLMDQFAGHHDNAYGDERKGSLTHEVIAGAASYEAMKLFEKHREKNSNPPSHDKAKEIVAGFAGAETEKLIEKHGLPHLDRDKASADAQQHAQQMYDEQQ